MLCSKAQTNLMLGPRPQTHRPRSHHGGTQASGISLATSLGLRTPKVPEFSFPLCRKELNLAQTQV